MSYANLFVNTGWSQFHGFFFTPEPRNGLHYTLRRFQWLFKGYRLEILRKPNNNRCACAESLSQIFKWEGVLPLFFSDSALNLEYPYTFNFFFTLIT